MVRRAMEGIARTVRRDIFRISLLLFSLCCARTDAVPWREKNTVRFATSLPKRLIDSIMAQGNWNILFQEGPFSEFQRQIAVATHFALRGEEREAAFWFERAASALDIAYASLRSRFEWPRSPQGLKAQDLPWGENREAFRDYLLCRLQLFLESGLQAHGDGKISLPKLNENVAQTETAIGVPLGQKDADLEAFVALVTEALAIRSQSALSPTARADRFSAATSARAASARNYWRRRALFFLIQEHLHYGNLTRAENLTNYLYDRHEEQVDFMAVARFWIQSSEFLKARRLLTEKFADKELRHGENYGEFVRLSEILQNLLVWLKDYREAAAHAGQTHRALSKLIADSAVPREEFVALRRSAANQKLREEMLLYLAEKRCPENPSPTAGSEPETEWRIRERIFYEKCGLAPDRSAWNELLQNPKLSAQSRDIVQFHLGIVPKVNQDRKSGSRHELLGQYLAQITLLHAPGNTAKKALRKQALAYLNNAAEIHADLVFLDWGLLLTEDYTDRALASLTAPVTAAEAAGAFGALHRNYAQHLLRGHAVKHLAPGDAAMVRLSLANLILDTERVHNPETPDTGTARILYYADAVRKISYDAREKKPALRIVAAGGTAAPDSSGVAALLFGAAADTLQPRTGEESQLAPLYSYCRDCTISARVPARLMLKGNLAGDWQSTTADLADIFSAVYRTDKTPECTATGAVYQDTLVSAETSAASEHLACDVRPETLVVEYEKQLTEADRRTLLGFAARQGMAALLLPRGMPVALRTSLLFDFLQRRNRRDSNARTAFAEAFRRAEKSFPAEPSLRAVYFYASPD